VLALIESPRLPHQTQHDVAALAGSVGMPPGVIAARRLNHPNQGSCLCGCDPTQILVEEVASCEGHTIDGSALVFTHPDVVDITLEDFVLGQAHFEHQRDGEFAELPMKAARVLSDKGSCQLLSQSARPLTQPMRMHIDDGCFDDADWVEAEVVIE